MVVMTMIAGKGLEKPPSPPRGHQTSSLQALSRTSYFPAGCRQSIGCWNSELLYPERPAWPCSLVTSTGLLISSCLTPLGHIPG